MKVTTDVKKAIVIGPTLMAISQFSGTFTLVNYAASIFKASGSDFDPNISSFFVGVLQIVGTSVTFFLIDRVGRKFLLIISTGGSAMGSMIMGTYSYLSVNGYDVSSFNMVPVVSLSFVIFISSIGIIPIPYIIAAELFPQKVMKSIKFHILTDFQCLIASDSSNRCWHIIVVSKFIWIHYAEGLSYFARTNWSLWLYVDVLNRSNSWPCFYVNSGTGDKRKKPRHFGKQII